MIVVVVVVVVVVIVVVIIIRMQKQISSWRKALSIIAEAGTGSDNGKLNRKKRKIFQKYRVTNAREFAKLTETMKQKVPSKAQRTRRYEKRETQYSQNKMFKEDTKRFYRNLGMKTLEAREPPSWQKQRHTGIHYGEKKHNIMKEQNG